MKQEKQYDHKGAARQSVRKSLAWAWVLKNHPQIAEAIIQEAAKRYPFKKLYSKTDISMLPK